MPVYPIIHLIGVIQPQGGKTPYFPHYADVATYGPATPGSVPLVGPNGIIDQSLLPPGFTGSGIDIQVSGVDVPDQSLLNFIPEQNISIYSDAFGGIHIAASGTFGTSFANITSGYNNSALMVVGGTGATGAVLTYADEGTVNANEIGGIYVADNVPTHPGMLLISQPGNETAVWGDPQVQGLYPEGASIANPPAYTSPTAINPVLVGGKGTDGNMYSLPLSGAGDAVVVVQQDEEANASHFAWDTGPTFSRITAGVLQPLLSITPQLGASSITFYLTGLDVLAIPAIGEWQLIKNGILTGASFANVPNSNAQQDTSATGITGGVRVDSGFTHNVGTRVVTYELSFGLVGSPPTADIFTLAIQPQSGALAASAGGTLRWTEQ